MLPLINRVTVLAWDDRWSISIWRAFQKISNHVEVIHAYDKSPSEVLDLVRKSKPDLCFSKNFRIAKISNPDTSEEWEYIFKNWDIPTAVWYLDNPEFQDPPGLKKFWKSSPQSNYFAYFYNDPSVQTFFEDKNLTAHHLPIGVDEAIFDIYNPELEKKFTTNLRFSGHTLAPCELPEVTPATVTIGHISMVVDEFEDSLLLNRQIPTTLIEKEIEIISQNLSRYFENFYTTAEDYFNNTNLLHKNCLESLQPISHSTYQSLQSRIVEVYSWWQMTMYLKLLEPLGLIIQGSPDWKGLFPTQKEPLKELSWDELFASYRASKISFCFTKWSLPYAVHDRIYEVYAAGGFPITDFRREIENHFLDDEIAVYNTIEEAKDLVRFYSKNESARMTLMRKGRARTLKEHTYSKRLTHLIEKFKISFGSLHHRTSTLIDDQSQAQRSE